MPKQFQKLKRPTDPVSNAILVMKIATGQLKEKPQKPTKAKPSKRN